MLSNGGSIFSRNISGCKNYLNNFRLLEVDGIGSEYIERSNVILSYSCK